MKDWKSCPTRRSVSKEMDGSPGDTGGGSDACACVPRRGASGGRLQSLSGEGGGFSQGVFVGADGGGGGGQERISMLSLSFSW